MNNNQNEIKWDQIIESKNHIFNFKLKEVWDYRDLLGLLIKRDFVAFYKQTILGPIWFFIQPIFTTITFTIVFSKIARISTDSLPPTLFYMVGVTTWNYFSESLNKTSTVFRDNAGIFGKVYFPRLIIPISVVLSSLIKLVVQFILLSIVMMYFYLIGLLLLEKLESLYFFQCNINIPKFLRCIRCLCFDVSFYNSKVTGCK